MRAPRRKSGMTVVVTANVEARYRGFLTSAMLEIAAGVYTGPLMTAGVRERVWDALERAWQGFDRNDVARSRGGGRAAHPNARPSAARDSGSGRSLPGKVQIASFTRQMKVTAQYHLV